MGPRPDSKSSPVLYCHLKVGSRWLKKSLGTTDMAVALERWPAAMQALRKKAALPTATKLIKPTDEAVVWDMEPDGTFKERKATAAEIYDPEDFELTWEQALQLHVQRQQERRGKPLAESTIRAIRQAYADIEVRPADTTTSHIRAYIKKLKDRGYGATTISQRCSLLQGVHQTLVRQDLLTENPWQRRAY